MTLGTGRTMGCQVNGAKYLTLALPQKGIKTKSARFDRGLWGIGDYGDIEDNCYFLLSVELELKAMRLNISLILDLTRLP